MLFGVAVLASLGLVWQMSSSRFAGIDSASRHFLLNQLWIVAAALAVAGALTLRRLSSNTISAVAIGWISVDLLWFAMGYNPAIPRDEYYPATPAIRALTGDTSLFRVLGLASVLPPNTAVIYGLNDVRGKDFTTLKRYEELITGTAGDFSFYEFAERLPAAFPLLNVKYVLAPERLPSAPQGFELMYDAEIAIYRYTRAAERALVVLDFEVEPDPAAILARLRSGSFDPSKTVLFETPPPAVPAGADPAIASAAARVVNYQSDRVVIDAELPRPGALLLLDNFYPGWRAFAGGRELPIQRADYTFRAVALPAGATRVEFLYQPRSFRLGLVLAALTAGGLAIAAIRDRRSRRLARIA